MTGRQVRPGAGNGDAPVSGAPAVSWIDAAGPGWLTNVLRAAGVAEAVVRHVEARPLAVASVAARLTATPPRPASSTRKIMSVAAAPAARRFGPDRHPAQAAPAARPAASRGQ
jgi:hypothetical protein